MHIYKLYIYIEPGLRSSLRVRSTATGDSIALCEPKLQHERLARDNELSEVERALLRDMKFASDI